MTVSTLVIALELPITVPTTDTDTVVIAMVSLPIALSRWVPFYITVTMGSQSLCPCSLSLFRSASLSLPPRCSLWP